MIIFVCIALILCLALFALNEPHHKKYDDDEYNDYEVRCFLMPSDKFRKDLGTLGYYILPLERERIIHTLARKYGVEYSQVIERIKDIEYFYK